MDRRHFAIGAGSLGVSAFGLSSSLVAQPKRPEDGVDYVSLDKPATVEVLKGKDNGKIEVIEFFWYSCPHCNRFEPELEEWIKRMPKDIYFKRIPVGFRDEFVPQQRLFYALEAMGKLPELHKKVFEAIHVKQEKLATLDVIAPWIARQGLDAEAFTKQYNSFTVSMKVQKATQLAMEYKVSGVPALGIAGRFYTDGALAQTMAKALTVTDYLIGVARGKAT